MVENCKECEKLVIVDNGGFPHRGKRLNSYICGECKKNNEIKKIANIIEYDLVGRSALENWFPDGRSLQQFNEVAHNRFYRLAEKIYDSKYRC